MARARLNLIRVVVVGGAVAVALAIAASAALSVRQRLIRTQYEHFHDDLLSIPLRTTSFAELQWRIKPWRRYAQFSDPCDAASCDIDIRLSPKLTREWQCSRNERLEWARMALLYIAGVRIVDTFAHIEVRNGYVWEIQYWLHVKVRRRLREMYLPPDLEAKLGSQLRFEPVHVMENGKSATPEFTMGAGHYIRFYESGRVTYTPYAPMAQIGELTRVNFSCVAGLLACRRPEQLVRAVQGLEGLLPDDNPGEDACSDSAVRITARDSKYAAIVEVVKNERPSAGRAAYGGTGGLFTLRMIESLKRADWWKVGTDRTLRAEEFDLPPYYSPGELKTGDRAIVVFDGNPENEAQAMWSPVCGMMRLSDATLVDVRKGAADDTRVPPYDSYERSHAKP
jgi:hypothetical protein